MTGVRAGSRAREWAGGPGRRAVHRSGAVRRAHRRARAAGALSPPGAPRSRCGNPRPSPRGRLPARDHVVDPARGRTVLEALDEGLEVRASVPPRPRGRCRPPGWRRTRRGRGPSPRGARRRGSRRPGRGRARSASRRTVAGVPEPSVDRAAHARAAVMPRGRAGGQRTSSTSRTSSGRRVDLEQLAGTDEAREGVSRRARRQVAGGGRRAPRAAPTSRMERRAPRLGAGEVAGEVAPQVEQQRAARGGAPRRSPWRRRHRRRLARVRLGRLGCARARSADPGRRGLAPAPALPLPRRFGASSAAAGVELQGARRGSSRGRGGPCAATSRSARGAAEEVQERPDELAADELGLGRRTRRRRRRPGGRRRAARVVRRAGGVGEARARPAAARRPASPSVPSRMRAQRERMVGQELLLVVHAQDERRGGRRLLEGLEQRRLRVRRSCAGRRGRSRPARRPRPAAATRSIDEAADRARLGVLVLADPDLVPGPGRREPVQVRVVAVLHHPAAAAVAAGPVRAGRARAQEAGGEVQGERVLAHGRRARRGAPRGGRETRAWRGRPPRRPAGRR